MAQKKNVKPKAAARQSKVKSQPTKSIVKKSTAKPVSSKASVSKGPMKKPLAAKAAPPAKPAVKAAASARPVTKPLQPVATKSSTAAAKPSATAGKAAPAVSKAAPAVGKAAPAVSKVAPAVGKVAPAVGKVAPAVGKSLNGSHPVKVNGKAAPAVGVPAKPIVSPVASVAKPKAVGAPVGTAATHRPVPVAAAVMARPVNGSASPQRPMPAAVAKPASPRLSSPVGPDPILEAARQAAAAAAALAAKKPVSSRHGFKTNESIVYPAHGVGRIVGIEEQEIAGISLELFVIQFEKDKMTLRVPTSKLASVGMRKLAEDGIVNRAMDTLKGKARIKRTMWSRRAQEYEAKINSGDLIAIAEVVRDLYRSEAQPEQSYSERQLYEAALDRMAREIAAVEKLDERGAIQRITEVLSKSARGRRAAEEAATAGEADIKAA
jgi:CarD family transcriptional regulator